jgi:hypothetical protein
MALGGWVVVLFSKRKRGVVFLSVLYIAVPELRDSLGQTTRVPGFEIF